VTRRVQLRELAVARAGDKGDISNICVVARDEGAWPAVRSGVTVERVAALYAGLVTGPIERYEVPNVHALNFVMHGALRGGVTRSLSLDPHGKTRSSLMLTLEIDIPGDGEPAVDG
jgi:hypothetical protein